MTLTPLTVVLKCSLRLEKCILQDIFHTLKSDSSQTWWRSAVLPGIALRSFAEAPLHKGSHKGIETWSVPSAVGSSSSDGGANTLTWQITFHLRSLKLKRL